ncbi:hypothetical protein RND71_012200 [Anisodus tanguticus]|uniref:Uncharacterized protein n=1 Tax=Anisodus tanguticus TaxID=243964 RepID=A0AAE1VFR7_9SOLA|nr:hypothetical protein RND71_012200 [Anisodus tanguticus]
MITTLSWAQPNNLFVFLCHYFLLVFVAMGAEAYVKFVQLCVALTDIGIIGSASTRE